MSDSNKQKRAVALGYDPSDEAPKVLATGTGVLAEKIIDKAKESEVPVHRDDKLAENLANLDVGEYIPPELYEVVAEILVFVNSVDNKLDRIKDKVR